MFELESTTTSLKNNLEAELQSLRESTASLKTQLRESESALNEATEQVAGAEKTVQEWESKSTFGFLSGRCSTAEVSLTLH